MYKTCWEDRVRGQGLAAPISQLGVRCSKFWLLLPHVRVRTHIQQRYNNPDTNNLTYLSCCCPYFDLLVLGLDLRVRWVTWRLSFVLETDKTVGFPRRLSSCKGNSLRTIRTADNYGDLCWVRLTTAKNIYILSHLLPVTAVLHVVSLL